MAYTEEERRKKRCEATKRWQAKHPEYNATKILRQQMIEAYGGKCICCEETTPEFLQLDHIFGDGAEERRKLGGTNQNVIRRLRKLGWPKDRYQLLCANCNVATMFGRVCPHKKI